MMATPQRFVYNHCRYVILPLPCAHPERRPIMHPFWENQLTITRRHFFGGSAAGLGVAALATLLGEEAHATNPQPAIRNPQLEGGLRGLPHFAPKARRVVYL